MKRTLGIAVVVFAAIICAQAQDEDREVRIGVLGLFHPRHIVLHRLAGHALECDISQRNGPIDGKLEVVLADQKPSDPRSSRSGINQVIACDDGSGGETEFVVSIPGKISRNYRGKLVVDEAADQFLIVVTMKLETAVASVVAAESPPDAPLEALKAQAIAARSFLVAGKGSHRDFDFCDTTHCQFLREPPAQESAAYQAAAQTRGLVLTYGEAEFAAMYSASCSGRTHSLEELGIPVRGYPYFSVNCDYCRRHPQNWSAKLSDEDAAELAGTEKSRLKVARKLGWKSVPSNFFEAEREDNAVVLRGVGAGHGIGLCQRGAADMAHHGSSFREILAHYYPNTALKQLR
jgi:peptidoglycan hydrolase-like amidase